MADYTRSNNETVTASDGGTANAAFNRSGAETVTASDGTSKVVVYQRSEAETLSAIDGVGSEAVYQRTRAETVGVQDGTSSQAAYQRTNNETVTTVDAASRIQGHLRFGSEIVTAADGSALNMALARSTDEVVTAVETFLKQANYLRSEHEIVTAVVVGIKEERNNTRCVEILNAVDGVTVEVTTRLSGTAVRYTRTKQVTVVFGLAGPEEYVVPPPDVEITVELVDSTGNTIETVSLDPLIFTEENTWQIGFVPATVRGSLVRVSVTGKGRNGILLLPITNVDDPSTGHPSPRTIIRRST